mmetsp:Transcript_45110/g.101846  ORF Transcript_45110/g.101846 Transcript_45110/m.101846 type:complete len:106 (+) Transcript_45110:568-885(+)
MDEARRLQKEQRELELELEDELLKAKSWWTRIGLEAESKQSRLEKRLRVLAEQAPGPEGVVCGPGGVAVDARGGSISTRVAGGLLSGPDQYHVLGRFSMTAPKAE